MFYKKKKTEIKSVKKKTRQGHSSLSKPRHNKKKYRGQG